MPELFISYDTSKPVGQRLAPEVVTEIEETAPSAVQNNSITTAKLADNAVTTPKINAGAVTSTKIATGGVATANLAASAVTGAKLATGAVTGPKAGAGVMRAQDDDGNDIALTFVPISAADHAALAEEDPNVLYGIY